MSEEKIGFLTAEEKQEIAQSRDYQYQLTWPVEIGDLDPIIEVVLRRFNGKQMKTINKIKDEFEKATKMIELSSRLTELQVDEMDFTDLTNLMEICSVFMDASLAKKKIPIGK